jgi:hypothetical protein
MPAARSPLGSLEQAIWEVRTETVIQSDDRVVWELHELRRKSSDRQAVFRRAPVAASEFELIDRRTRPWRLRNQLGFPIARKRSTDRSL